MAMQVRTLASLKYITRYQAHVMTSWSILGVVMFDQISCNNSSEAFRLYPEDILYYL
jgi:hypothetical protein